MRVLVSSDRIGRLGPAGASDLLATAFAEHGAQVAVAPMAAGGSEFAAAAARFTPQADIRAVLDLDQLLAAASGYEAFLDATVLATPTWEELTGLSPIPVSSNTLVVPESEAELTLTGLQGAIATQGRDSGQELGETLARNEAAERWLGELGIPDQPGAGALGGLGAWALAQGMTVTSGLQVCRRLGSPLRKVGLEEGSEARGTFPVPEPDTAVEMWNWEQKGPKMNLPGPGM